MTEKKSVGRKDLIQEVYRPENDQRAIFQAAVQHYQAAQEAKPPTLSATRSILSGSDFRPIKRNPKKMLIGSVRLESR